MTILSPKTSAVARALSAPGTQRKWMLGSLLLAGSAAVIMSFSAWAGGAGQGAMGACMHHMGGMGGMHGGMSMPFAGPSMNRMLDRVDATPAQRAQIQPIVDKATKDLTALHDEGRALHEQGMKLWSQPKLDASAAEKVRKQMLRHHDKVSQRMLQAMLEVGNVLTPAQRAQLAERMQKRHERMMERRAASQPEPGQAPRQGMPMHERHGPRHGAGMPVAPEGAAAASQPGKE